MFFVINVKLRLIPVDISRPNKEVKKDIELETGIRNEGKVKGAKRR